MPTDARTPAPWTGRALGGLRWSAAGGSSAGGLVVAVHGITANAAAWAAVAPRLLRGRAVAEVVAPELRGRGASRRLPGPWGLARHADDVAAEVTALLDARVAEPSGRRAVLVGHSMGAFVLAALVKILLEEIDQPGRHTSTTTLVPTQLVVRSSTGPPPR